MSRGVAAVLAGVALVAAACGGGPGKKQPGAQTKQQGYQQAVAFAKCMRSHGDPAFPDPGPNGAFPNENGSLDRTSAAYKTALAACKSLQPNSPPDQAELQAMYQRLLKFSSCMRAHGMTNFPNPTLDKGGVGISDHIDPNSPQYKTAHAACRSLEPGPGNP
jgi:hypothetical protein